MKKSLALVVAVLFIAGVIPAYAEVNTEIRQSISASGTLVLQSTLAVSGGPLTFNTDHTDLAITAPQTITVNFDGAQAAFQAIIVSCNNPNYTGEGNGDGLVGESDTDVSVPLFWAVFDDENEASLYQFAENDNGYIDSTYQPYLINKSPSEMTDGKVDPDQNELAYASAIWDVNGRNAKLADFPYNASGDHQLDNPRIVNNGMAYLKFAADFHNAPAQNYSTTINLDLVTIS